MPNHTDRAISFHQKIIRLMEIRKRRDALLSKSTVNLQVNVDGIDQARKASVQIQAESAAVKNLGALGGAAITSKAIAPRDQYQELLGSALKASRALASGAASAPGVVSQESQDRERSHSSGTHQESMLWA